MTELNSADTYHAPTSPEAISDATERARQDAMRAAFEIHAIDPTDIDAGRNESTRRINGSLSKTAVEGTAQVSPREFDPTNTAQLINVGKFVIHYRQSVLEALAGIDVSSTTNSKDDFTLAA